MHLLLVGRHSDPYSHMKQFQAFIHVRSIDSGQQKLRRPCVPAQRDETRRSDSTPAQRDFGRTRGGVRVAHMVRDALRGERPARSRTCRLREERSIDRCTSEEARLQQSGFSTPTCHIFLAHLPRADATERVRSSTRDGDSLSSQGGRSRLTDRPARRVGLERHTFRRQLRIRGWSADRRPVRSDGH